MKRRHALRFENGERRGETLPLDTVGAGGVLAIGRRPGNTIVIADPSVSGRHAELTLDEAGMTVRDLGSTNGTRVGDERVSEQRLAHGDVLTFGNVRATFLDALVDEPGADPVSPPALEAPGAQPRPAAPPKAAAQPPSAARTAARAEAAGDDVHTISADALARSRGRFSAGTWALLALIAGGGGGAYFWLRSQGGGVSGAAPRAVIEVPGNLLSEGFSFEEAAPDGRPFEDRWSAAEAAPVSFGVDSSARRTGERGLSVALVAGEWAEHRSEAVRAPRGGTLEVLAWARLRAAAARAGVRFEDSTGSARALTVWAAPLSAGEDGDFRPLEVSATVPPGYDTARAVVRARMEPDPAAGPDSGAGPGSDAGRDSDAGSDSGAAPQGIESPAEGWVEFDDVSLVTGSGAASTVRVGEYELTPMGQPEAVLNLFKIDRVLVSGLAVVTAGGTGSALSREERETGALLFPARAGTLSFFAEPALVEGGVATVGSDGYRSHQVDFEREGVRSILLGAGRDMVRIGLAAPAAVTGRPAEAGFRFEVPVGADGPIEVQLVFNVERNEGQSVARDARGAEQRGAPGAAVVLWERVLTEFPFEADLLEEAAATRGRLVSAGLGELRDLDRRVERARFFRLVDDYRACRFDVRAQAERYAGTEVEAGARALIAEIDVQLAELEGDLDRHERARLESIARSLQAGESPLLAARVQEYLEAHFAPTAPEGGAGAPTAPASGAGSGAGKADGAEEAR